MRSALVVLVLLVAARPAVGQELWYGDVDEPLAIATGFRGEVVIADGSPARVISIKDKSVLEFSEPSTDLGYFPVDVAISGFFVYVVNENDRSILRFSDEGAFRDVLVVGGNPFGLAVDPAGRVALTDVRNHTVTVYDVYLKVELKFGNYGVHEGQLSAPEGVEFSKDGRIWVADTGNQRVQVFSATGAWLAVVPVPDGTFSAPRRVTSLGKGRAAVADPDAQAVFVVDRDSGLLQAWRPDDAEFSPIDVAVTGAGEVLVLDAARRAVLRFTPE